MLVAAGAYLAANAIADSFDINDESRSPFAQDGRVHVYAANVYRFVQTKVGEQVKRKEFQVALRRTGAEPVKIPVPCKKTTRQPWRLSVEFAAPLPEVPESAEAIAESFFIERLVFDPTASMTATAVGEAYDLYAKKHNVIKQVSDKVRAGVLEGHGCKSDRCHAGRYWHGVRPCGPSSAVFCRNEA